MTVLDNICARKKEHVADRKAQTPLSELNLIIKDQPPTRGFKKAITHRKENSKIALIAEIKKASPSSGLIRKDFNPHEIALAYERSGATCLSVLTDEPYFQGKDEYLSEAKAASSLPVLRKDFTIDPYQIYESRALGADCILLIMAALENNQALELCNLAHDLGMDVLVEVHNIEELDRAKTLSPEMIGVNNRNLKTLQTDLATGLALSKALPAETIKIAESGFSKKADLMKYTAAGYSGFLIGESLMRQNNIEKAVKELLA